MKLIIAGGGTGGHLYPGIALARELLARDGSHDILFVGTKRGLETRIVPREGFRLEFIDSAGLKGMGMVTLLRNLLIVPVSIRQSLRLVRRYQPDVVVGVGGYSSGPVVLASWLRGAATCIIEPNAHPGMTNRWLTRIVRRAALALPDEGNCFGSKGVVTGIPVRREFRALKPKPPGRDFTLLVYGGSQGSHALNSIVCSALRDLKELTPPLRIIHQTGEKELDLVRRAYAEAGVHGEVQPFLPKIYEEFGTADLIMSRAGASTMAELTVAGKPAILVPFPGAADNHQAKNAAALQRFGAARMIPEQDWRPGLLAEEIRRCMANPEELRKMSEAARQLARPDAAARIADLVLELAAARENP